MFTALAAAATFGEAIKEEKLAFLSLFLTVH